MNPAYNKYLVFGAALSAFAALLHIGCIIFGASWYRFFGAGEEMASMAEAGSIQPAIITSFIVIVLTLWSLYALSGAGVISKLPLLKAGLCVITAIYLIRGIAPLPFIKHFPENSPLFWVVSSSVCLLFGLVHLAGLNQVWRKL